MCQTNTPLDIAKAFCEVALDMQKSSYPNVLKFYAADRAVMETYAAYGSTNSRSISVEKEFAPMIRQNLLAVLQDKTTPPEEVYEDCVDGLSAFSSEDCIQAYSMIEPLLFTNWPDITQGSRVAPTLGIGRHQGGFLENGRCGINTVARDVI
jgi:hypothetical protein